MRGSSLVVCLLLVACKQPSHAPERTDDYDRYEKEADQLDKELEALEHALDIYDGGVPEPVAPEPPVAAEDSPAEEPAADEPVTCIAPDDIDGVRLTGKTMELCGDADDDDEWDCVVYDAKGRRLKTVHHAEPGAPIDVVDDRAEICPYDGACVRMKPRLADGEELQDAWLTWDEKDLALILGTETQTTAVELRDPATGRARKRIDVSALGAKLDVKFPPGAVLAVADGDSEDLGHYVLYGRDGKKRVDVGGGSTRVRNYTWSDQMFSAFVLGTEDIGTVVGYDLRTGRKLGSFAITPLPDDLLDVDDAGGHQVAIVYEDHVDVVDVVTHRKQTRPLPACDE